ncbi:anti-sigma factor domain-containing protein [Deinococcus sp.]|uniref:anti-sigma factor n=1 Tax=Deinococcus sp. TaxID=47478 RepID=UPI002869CE8C|nr:anti-sigma factor [Deinococcus sp.]
MNIDRDHLLASALGQLSPAEEAQVQAVLRADPALQAEYQAEQEALMLLLGDLDLDSVTLPADAEDRLLARIRAEDSGVEGSEPEATRAPLASPGTVALVPGGSLPASAPTEGAVRSRTRPAWWLALPLGLAAALAVFFALRPDADLLVQYAATPGAVSRQVTANGQSLGTLVRLPDGRVFVKLGRPADSGRTYQLWQIAGGKPVSLGIFGDQGVLTAPLPEGATLAVSVEPPGGSAQPTTTPLFAQAI